jgi:hypothetical protein
MARSTLAEDLEGRRRVALAVAFDRVATQMVERVVAEAVRASSFFGLSGDVAKRYGQSIEASLPFALETLTEPTADGRRRKMAELVTRVRGISNDHHVPRIIERGLVGIAFAVARRAIRDGADRSGFTADDLDTEFMAFRIEFEAALFDDEPSEAGPGATS